MGETRSVVITGASRGLGFATAKYLYTRGWHVVAAMRSPESGMARLYAKLGTSEADPRLTGVQLDLVDPESVAAAATAIRAAVGAPFGVVHNAGIAAAGSFEETPVEVWTDLFATHLFGPVALTKALLPGIRESGYGRIVFVSSQGGVRGMPEVSAYSAVKASVERWGEALAGEVAPFGVGVTVLVTGVFDTEIITDATPTYRDMEGPYSLQHTVIDRRGRMAMRIAKPPEKFAAAVARTLDDTAPFVRRSVGVDALMLMVANRVLPSRGLHQMVRLAMGLPRFGALRSHASARVTHSEQGEPTP